MRITIAKVAYAFKQYVKKIVAALTARKTLRLKPNQSTTCGAYTLDVLVIDYDADEPREFHLELGADLQRDHRRNDHDHAAFLSLSSGHSQTGWRKSLRRVLLEGVKS